MEPTRACPQCGTLAPVSARRCKECFHDFRSAPKPANRSSILLPILGAAAVMSALGAGAVAWMTSFPVHEQALVDGTTRQIQWVREFKDGHLETDQVGFDDVTRIEYRAEGGTFTVVAMLKQGGEREIVRAMNQPLLGQAEQYAEILGKPLEIVDANAPKAP